MPDPRKSKAFDALPPRPNPRPDVRYWASALSLQLTLPLSLRDPLQFAEWRPKLEQSRRRVAYLKQFRYARVKLRASKLS